MVSPATVYPDKICSTLPGFEPTAPHEESCTAMNVYSGCVPRLQRSRSNSCVDGRPTLSLGEISKLLSCAVCKAVPITSLTVHCCANGHQACGNCFSTGYRSECSRLFHLLIFTNSFQFCSRNSRQQSRFLYPFNQKI